MSLITKSMTVPKFVGNGIIEYAEKPVPMPGEEQLLIRVKANALCGSERGQFFQGTSITAGHEASGIVVAAGRKTRTKVGTHGVVYLMEFCGKCRSCKLGYTNQCLDKKADYGFSHDGGYGSYMLINEKVFFEIDPSIPLTEATMLLDIMGTGGHAIKRARLVHPDIQSVVIAGAGPVGLGVLAMVRLLLGQEMPVFIMDFVEFRLRLAANMGAVPVHLNKETLSDKLEACNLNVVDVAIDTTGKTAGRQTALASLGKRGVLVCVGHGEQLQLEVSSDLIARERAVLGSEYFQYSELTENHELILNNLPYLSQIITHRFGADQIQEAFELFFKGNTGKVVIEQ